MAAAVFLEVGDLLLQAEVLFLQAAVIHKAVEAIHWEVAVTPCWQQSRVAVGLVVHLCRRLKWDMMFALRQTSLI